MDIVINISGIDEMIDELEKVEKEITKLQSLFKVLNSQLVSNFKSISAAAVKMRNDTIKEINHVFKAIQSLITVTSNFRKSIEELGKNSPKHLGKIETIFGKLSEQMILKTNLISENWVTSISKMKEELLGLAKTVSEDTKLNLLFSDEKTITKEMLINCKINSAGGTSEMTKAQFNDQADKLKDLEETAVESIISEIPFSGLVENVSSIAYVETLKFISKRTGEDTGEVEKKISEGFDILKQKLKNLFIDKEKNDEMSVQEKMKLGIPILDNAYVEEISSKNELLTDSMDRLNETINKINENDLSYLKGDYYSGGAVGSGFAIGGFTGTGGKYTPAGIVHKGEYVLNQEMVRGMPGVVSWLEGVRTGKIKGYSDGGMADFSMISNSFVVDKSANKVAYSLMTLKEKIDLFINQKPYQNERAGKIFFKAEEQANKFSEKLKKAGTALESDFLNGMSTMVSSVGNIMNSMGNFKKAGGSFSNLLGNFTNLGMLQAGMGVVGAVSSAIDIFGGLVSTEEETNSINAETDAEWEKQNNILSDINENIKSASEGLAEVFTNTLSQVINKGTTNSNINQAKDELSGIMKRAYSKRDFGNLSFTWQEKRKKFLRGTERRRHVETFGMNDALKNLGIGGDISKVNLNELSKISNSLKNTSLKDIENKLKRGKLSKLSFAQSLGTVFGGSSWKFDGVKSSNFKAVAKNIDEYISMIKKAQKELKDFYVNATLGDFEGMNVQSVDTVKEQLKADYEKSGIEITAEVDRELDKLAQKKAIQETMSSQVRSGMVTGLAQGMDSMDIIGDQMSSYFSGMFSNISKAFYDTQMSDFNDSISDFYIKFNTDLANAKQNGVNIFDFAEGYDYSSVLSTAMSLENTNNEIDTVFNEIRKQAEAMGLDNTLINTMLPNDEISKKAKSLTESFESSFSSIFETMDFSKFESSLGETIFNTIKTQAIQAFMESAKIESKMTDYIGLLEEGKTEEAQTLMKNLVVEAKVGYENISQALELAEQDIRASGLDVDSQSVSSSTIESNQSYYTPTSGSQSSTSSGTVTNVNVYVQNGNYYMTQDELITQIREGIKKAEGGEV